MKKRATIPQAGAGLPGTMPIPDDVSGSRARPWKPSKLAERLGVSAKTIKRRIIDGALPAIPLGCNRHAIPAHVCLHVLRYGLNAYVRPDR